MKTKFVEPLFVGKESKDERHTILKEIYESDITNNMIGYFDGFKYTHKFDKNMTNILPHITECIALYVSTMSPRRTFYIKI